MEPAVASAENLSAHASGRPLLLDRSFRILSGEVLAAVGPNGAGKTTLLRIAAGLLRPKSGRMEVCGADLLAAPLRATASLYHVIEPDTPYDFLHFRGYADVHRAIYRKWDDAEAIAIARTVGVPFGQPLATMSRGERLKARLACAFGSGCRFLVLDEPFETLDDASRGWLRARLRTWREDRRGGILYSAHRQEDVADVASGVFTA